MNERNARFLLNLRGFTVTFTQISGNVQSRKGTLKTHFWLVSFRKRIKKLIGKLKKKNLSNEL